VSETFVHPLAVIDDTAVVGEGSMIWEWSKLREGARLGRGCRVGQGVYVDRDVSVGDGCKIQNGVSLFAGVTLADHVFVGPNVTFTNDLFPRATDDDWEIVPTTVAEGASIGANATIVCGIELGAGCMIGAGSVVVRDVPPFGLVVGNPARLIDYVTERGQRMHRDPHGPPPTRDEVRDG
jgi:acetyltransferase-like isoleucine patch superfamily enzyme